MLARRRRVDEALYALVMEAYLQGATTRKVDDLVKPRAQIPRYPSPRSRKSAWTWDTMVGAFRDRELSALDFPYVFLDATHCMARNNHRVVSHAVEVSFGVATDERCEVLGFEVGATESPASWTAFLRWRTTRGLCGVKLVISDARSGLNTAIATELQDASWQRCRVHWIGTKLAVVPKGSQDMVALIIHTAFAQPDVPSVNKQFGEVSTVLAKPILRSRRCSMTPGVTCSRSPVSRGNIDVRCGPRIRWSDLIGTS